MQLLTSELKTIWNKFADKTVRVVCFPLPPVPTKEEKIVYMPDSFMSRVCDKAQRFKVLGVDQDEVLAVLMTENGPAIVVDMRLHQLISFSHQTSHYDQVLSVYALSHAICAGISFYPYVEEDGYTFVDQVSLDSLRFGGSCNPGSHYVVPQAPYLTSILQYRSAPKVSEVSGTDYEIEWMTERAIKYLSPIEVEMLFPNIPWAKNSVVDEFVSKCLISKDDSFYQVLTGLGDWAKPYLRDLRHNHLIKKEKLYAALSTISLLSEKSKAVV